MFTYELARRLQGTTTTANCLHPGFVNSNFGDNNKGMVRIGLSAAKSLGAISIKKEQRRVFFGIICRGRKCEWKILFEVQTQRQFFPVLCG